MMQMDVAGLMIPGAMLESTVPGTEVKSYSVMEVSLLDPTHLMPRFLPLVVKGLKEIRK